MFRPSKAWTLVEPCRGEVRCTFGNSATPRLTEPSLTWARGPSRLTWLRVRFFCQAIIYRVFFMCTQRHATARRANVQHGRVGCVCAELVESMAVAPSRPLILSNRTLPDSVATDCSTSRFLEPQGSFDTLLDCGTIRGRRRRALSSVYVRKNENPNSGDRPTLIRCRPRSALKRLYFSVTKKIPTPAKHPL